MKLDLPSFAVDDIDLRIAPEGALLAPPVLAFWSPMNTLTASCTCETCSQGNCSPLNSQISCPTLPM